LLQNDVNVSHWPLEMGRMSDYNIRPKSKVWTGPPNECRTFGQMLCAGWNKVFYWWVH